MATKFTILLLLQLSVAVSCATYPAAHEDFVEDPSFSLEAGNLDHLNEVSSEIKPKKDKDTSWDRFDCCSSESQDEQKCNKKPLTIKECELDELAGRLSNRVKPTTYQLSFAFDNSTSRFRGRAKIELNFTHPSEDQLRSKHRESHMEIIDLHADPSMQIYEIIFFDGKKRTREVTDVCRQGDLLRVTLPKHFPTTNKVMLKLMFCSLYGKNNTGIYKSDGNIVSQFESMFAREAFPCFDEPNLKAKFKVDIEHKSDLTALSNTERVSQVKSAKKGYTKTTFDETPVMSTYLVALAVGQYDWIERDGKTPMRAYIGKGLKELSRYALNMASRSVSFMNEYTKVPYNLGKLDLVAVGDFRASAMENWGLITFQNASIYSGDSDPLERFRVGLVVAHEVAHQWFGNLVTMNWWTELWLNEGFAEFFSLKILEQCKEKVMAQGHHLDSIMHLMRREALDREPRAIQPTHIITKDNVDRQFDAYTYVKGAAFLRMLESSVGSVLFQQAVSSYIQKHRYSNTKAKDLLRELSIRGTPPAMNMFFDTWLNQSGFPLISVDYNLNGKDLNLKQEEFPALKRLAGVHNQIWYIPVTITFGDIGLNMTETVKVDMTQQELTIPLPAWFRPEKETSWLMLNRGLTGYYLVRYSPELTHQLYKIKMTQAALSSMDIVQLDFEHQMLTDFKVINPLKDNLNADPIVMF